MTDVRKDIGSECCNAASVTPRVIHRLYAVGLMLLAWSNVAQSEAVPFTSAYVARWNLDNGSYLVDTGQYLEAIEAFDTAIEMAESDEVRAEGLLLKGSVLSVFLDAPEDAVKAYDTVVTRYPTAADAEPALFQAGMVLFDAGEFRRAAAYFERYVQRFPKGVSAASAEFLLKQSRAKFSEPPVVATVPPPSAMVRIRILKGADEVSVSSAGVLSTSPQVASGSRITLRARSGLVVGGSSREGLREVVITAEKPLRLRTAKSERQYRGRFVITAFGDTLQVVNLIGVEQYLYGVVTKESVSSWPLEALKAQAIASRSYALYNTQRPRTASFDMVNDEGSQVYGGIDGESAAARRAVDETRGMVMAYRGRPIYAMFTSNTGWHSGDARYIFDQPLPYLLAVPDPYSPNETMGRWTRKFSAAEIRERLSAQVRKPFGRIREIRPIAGCPSGRAVRVQVVDEYGVHEMRTRQTLGRALKLPDILFSVRREGDQFVFTGGGFGHGVGLSQWGSKAMADKGFKAGEILAFYYQNAELVRLAP